MKLIGTSVCALINVGSPWHKGLSHSYSCSLHNGFSFSCLWTSLDLSVRDRSEDCVGLTPRVKLGRDPHKKYREIFPCLRELSWRRVQKALSSTSVRSPCVNGPCWVVFLKLNKMNTKINKFQQLDVHFEEKKIGTELRNEVCNFSVW